MSAVIELNILSRTEALLKLWDRVWEMDGRCAKNIKILVGKKKSLETDKKSSKELDEINTLLKIQGAKKEELEHALYLINGLAKGLELTPAEKHFFAKMAQSYSEEAKLKNKSSVVAEYICNLLNTFDPAKSCAAEFYHLLEQKLKRCEEQLKFYEEEIAFNKKKPTKSQYGSQEYERLKKEEVQTKHLALSENQEYILCLKKILLKVLKIIKNYYYFQNVILDEQKKMILDYSFRILQGYKPVTVVPELQPKTVSAELDNFILDIKTVDVVQVSEPPKKQDKEKVETEKTEHKKGTPSKDTAKKPAANSANNSSSSHTAGMKRTRSASQEVDADPQPSSPKRRKLA